MVIVKNHQRLLQQNAFIALLTLLALLLQTLNNFLALSALFVASGFGAQFSLSNKICNAAFC